MVRPSSKVLAVLLLVLGVTSASHPSATSTTAGRASQQPSASTSQPIGLLRQWVAAVNQHEPGNVDDSLLAVGAWSAADLELLFPYVKALAELTGTDETGPRLAVFSGVEMVHLRGLASDARGQDVNRLMKRGALMHSDLASSAGTGAGNPTPRPPPATPPRWPRPRGSPAYVPWRTTIHADDGRYEGFGRQSIHWEFARMLLDAVRPVPSRDEMVRRWYHAIATYFADAYNLAELVYHLESGLRLFPRDANLLLDRGCMHETMASSQIQAVVQAAALRNVNIKIATESSNLRDAERYFREALDTQPELIEARVRLGRVLVLRDRADEAKPELRRALTASGDSILLYYTHLFLAGAEQQHGDAAAARQAYQAAATLYPRAQSPRLGLSQLARHQGDRAGALRALQHVLSLPAEEHERQDPWWDYYKGLGRHHAALLEDVAAPFRRGSR